MLKLDARDIQTVREIRINRILGLKDNGRRNSVRCPFHSEKTPSLVIYPDNSFHCYGCGANGQGAIDFCLRMGYTFVESLEELIKYL